MLRSSVRPWLLLVLFPLAACDDDPVAPPGDELFSRYVALGNSITAGFESDGINDSTQMHAYPVLLSDRVGASFDVALLRRPGCPPPLVSPAPLSTARVDGAAPGSCAGFESIPNLIQSLAFPGFRIADALTVPGGDLGLIHRQALGTRSLVQAMSDSDPTFVTVYLGNNDALSAMTTGDPGQLTALDEFAISLGQIVTALAAEPTLQDAVLIGVTDPLFAPLVQPGVYFSIMAEGGGAGGFLPKPVEDDCSARDESGAPNPRAVNLVSFRAFADPGVTSLSCADDAPYVLTPDEQAEITARVDAFNALIRDAADANGWIYLDSSEIAGSLFTDPDLVRGCQDLDPTLAMDAILQAIDSSCPHPGAPGFFGAAISFDGVHPSLRGQEILADALYAAIVARYGSDL